MFYNKKSLGQNFLRSKKILSDIVRAGNILPAETVLEAGPGTGNLTAALLASGARVVAVEKDRRLIPPLKEKFAHEIQIGRLKLIEADVLSFDVKGQLSKVNGWKIVANLPYYITGAFIRKFLETEYQPSCMVLLLQKEVAERIVARDGSPLHLCHCHRHKQLSEVERQNLKQLYEKGLGQRCGGKESLFSMSVKAYGTPRYIETVKAGNFSPAPKVDSAIISIENISKKFSNGFSEREFFKILKAGFAHKRKQLVGTLGLDVETLRRAGIAPKARPEELGLKDWLCLLKSL